MQGKVKLVSHGQHLSGYTLVELITVILIIGIMGYVAFTAWTPKDYTLHAQANLLKYDLRYAQALAVAGHHTMQIRFSKHGYRLIAPRGTAVLHNLHQLPGNITLHLSQVLPSKALLFNPLGIPLVSKNKVLSKALVFTLALGGNTQVIHLVPQTGSVY